MTWSCLLSCPSPPCRRPLSWTALARDTWTLNMRIIPLPPPPWPHRTPGALSLKHEQDLTAPHSPGPGRRRPRTYLHPEEQLSLWWLTWPGTSYNATADTPGLHSKSARTQGKDADQTLRETRAMNRDQLGLNPSSPGRTSCTGHPELPITTQGNTTLTNAKTIKWNVKKKKNMVMITSFYSWGLMLILSF